MAAAGWWGLYFRRIGEKIEIAGIASCISSTSAA